MKKGIDVSFAQGHINWGKVKTDFAIIRAGYGNNKNQEDSQFRNNYTGCKSNNIPIGVYWYSYAESVEDAKNEAKACLEVIKGKTFEYPIFFDIEENRQIKLGKKKCCEIIKAFLEVVEKAGYWVGIYSYASFLKNYVSSEIKNRYAVWVAHTNVSKPDCEVYGTWQYSFKGRIDGIYTDVDLDYCYIDYPTLIKNAGLNGIKKSGSTSKSKKSVSEIAKEVIKGLWGNGDERKKNLKNAGYNYDEVQKKVNELCK